MCAVTCEILSIPRYVCADLRCQFSIEANNANFEKYVDVMDACQPYLKLKDRKLTCECGTSLKASLEFVPVLNELQLFFICRNGVCDFKRSMPQLKNSRIRCVCEKFCERDGEIYKCPRGEKGCGTYFHELDSFTFIHTIIQKIDLEDDAWAYLPINVKPLKCGAYGILKYNSEQKRLNLVCKNLFCDCSRCCYSTRI
ncbi:Hypothetical predicted protein [Paramuricea clavata]|uniref:Uncharacterized protein n=1 Tax=Paramuricea clavata TaxID=317549 RepID=A0A6S7FX40_PARCT|nr:Hypothetical predicted protein [Paramuricea clavata]